MEVMEPDAKRRRIQGMEAKQSVKKQSTLFAFARRPATPLSADEQSKIASFRTEWIPKVGEGWCNALLPVLRTVLVMLESDGKQQTHGQFFRMSPLSAAIPVHRKLQVSFSTCLQDTLPIQNANFFPNQDTISAEDHRAGRGDAQGETYLSSYRRCVQGLSCHASGESEGRDCWTGTLVAESFLQMKRVDRCTCMGQQCMFLEVDGHLMQQHLGEL